LVRLLSRLRRATIRILPLDPAALARTSGIALPLGRDTLEPSFADRFPEYASVVEAWADVTAPAEAE
jgi:hypothetical protein